MIEEEERIMERWRKYFRSLSVPDQRRANIIHWGMEKGKGRIHCLVQVQDGISREKFRDAING